ncbi:MAG: BrnT family toxin [Acidobacteriaceae bacterium]
MDVLFLYRGQTYVWEGRKAIENRAKHGVAFEAACEAFFDPAFLTEDASVEEESRMALIGTNIQEDLL